MTDATEATRGPDHHVRNRITLIVVGSVAVAAVAAGLIVAGIHGAEPGGPVPNALQPVATQQAAPSDTPATGGSSSTATPAPGGTKSEAPAARSDEVKYGQKVAETVSTKQQAKTPAGLTAAVTKLEAYTATASRAGEVSGPSVKATITLTNNTGAAVPLTAVTVNGYYGDDATPAARVDSDKATKPFGSELAPGATATATYVFTVPDDAKTVTVTLADAAGAKLVVFTGTR